MRYQANSLITYKNSKDFNREILDFINKSSPLLSQQLVVPNNEIDRLLLKFDIFDSYSDNPDLIIINKNNKVLAKSLIDLKIFCKKFEGQNFTYYIKLTSNLNCT